MSSVARATYAAFLMLRTLSLMARFRKLFRLLWGWLPLVLWMGLLYWLSDQPKLPHPARKMGLSDYFFDYSAHAFSFGVLTVLAWRAFRSLSSDVVWADQAVASGRARSQILWSGLFAALYAVFDELHQRMVPGRWSSLKDWLADVAGVLVAMGFLWLWLRWRGAVRRRLQSWVRWCPRNA